MKRIFTLIIIYISVATNYAQQAILHTDFDDCYNTIAMDEDNDVLWVGTSFLSGGILSFRTADGDRIDLTEIDSDINFQGLSRLSMYESTLYAAGFGAVLVIDYDDPSANGFFTTSNSNLNFNNEIRSISYDPNSELIYAGNPTTSTDIYDGNSWTTSDSYTRITASSYVDEYDMLYLVSSSGSLYTIDEGGSVQTFNSTNSPIPALPYHDIAVYAGNDGDDDPIIYLSTFQQGLVVYDGESATHYTTSNSNIFSGDLNYIEVDHQGTLWIAHNGGITSLANNTFTTYPLEPLIDVFTDISDIAVDSNNHLWLAGCAGLIEFWLDPSSSEEITFNELQLYPNPAYTEVIIEAPMAGKLELVDQLGRVVLSKPLLEGTHTINTGRLSGSYIARIKSKEKIWQTSLIIQQ